MEFFSFFNDKQRGIKHIVVNKIDSYGIILADFDEDGDPKTAIVWVRVGGISHDKSTDYEEGLKTIEMIDTLIRKEES